MGAPSGAFRPFRPSIGARARALADGPPTDRRRRAATSGHGRSPGPGSSEGAAGARGRMVPS